MERESRVSLPCFHIPADTQWLPSTIAQHNLLGSGGIMKVTATFQGISVALTDVDVLFLFNHFLEGKIKKRREMACLEIGCRTTPGL